MSCNTCCADLHPISCTLHCGAQLSSNTYTNQPIILKTYILGIEYVHNFNKNICFTNVFCTNIAHNLLFHKN